MRGYASTHLASLAGQSIGCKLEAGVTQFSESRNGNENSGESGRGEGGIVAKGELATLHNMPR